MYVLTVDQIASRTGPDRAAGVIESINDRFPDRLLLQAERTAGDEFQLATEDAEVALAIAFDLLRDRGWSVGVGQGDVRRPLPDSTRAATGQAFYAAREAVTRAKRAPFRFALEAADQQGGADVEALIVLLLHLRDRRTAGGWEVADLLAAGVTQSEAAARLGITESSVSRRVSAAGVRAEAAATTALIRLLAKLDQDASVHHPDDRKDER
ncbi:DNA-binding protein [Plantibacter sp. VKM Ac-2885]|uniref:DNA-binding protein n=1 Tax=Plantibacter sp. VKM Ac-2885 TaxID=2783828 RepID=UPI00188CFD6D|nr:DNA-binding protein [Plantibacter sp. VKM Ac-2885]